jgi:hypothetical protein
MMLVFQESNFYNSVATVYFDLVVFGTSVMLIYEDFENVIHCYNPCFGEYYLDNDGKFRPCIFYREFTLTIAQVVAQFGRENCSTNVQKLYDEGKAGLTREIIVAHAIEPNENSRKYGIPENFKFREVYWEWGGSASPQGGISGTPGFLRKRGFFEAPHIAVRWDLVSNDAYGRSPGMDALPDIKQLQQEVRRKAQAIDKSVNPPMVADIQLKNQPASLLPGYYLYRRDDANWQRWLCAGLWKLEARHSRDLRRPQEIRQRIKTIFFNDLFQVISQFQTRSNVSATEIDARRSEAMVMIGPVLERIQYELLDPIIDRTFAVMSRARVIPPPLQRLPGRILTLSMYLCSLPHNSPQRPAVLKELSNSLEAWSESIQE